MIRTDNIRFSLSLPKSIIFLVLACVLCLNSFPTFGQEFVLPDFGNSDAPPSEENANNEAASDDFDFFDSAPFDSNVAQQAEEFDFEKTPEEVQEGVRRDAFDAALQGLMPLRPNEIRELLEQFDRTQESVELPVYPAPKAEVAVETLSLDPGTKPTSIKVSYGYVTTLNIVDSTGAPWPVEDITWAGNFEVIESTGEGAHFLRISPQSEFAYGNMSIHLAALQTPIIISLETSRDLVHYRFDAIVPKAGPFAKTPIIQSGVSISAGDADLASFLQGVMPPKAERLSVSGVDGRTSAYNFNGMTYLRTPLTLLSPAWISSASSADGMRVYAMDSAPVLLLSENGRMVKARLSDREDLLDDR